MVHNRTAGISSRWHFSTRFLLGCGLWECSQFCLRLLAMSQMPFPGCSQRATSPICLTGGGLTARTAGESHCTFLIQKLVFQNGRPPYTNNVSLDSFTKIKSSSEKFIIKKLLLNEKINSKCCITKATISRTHQ